MTAGDTYAGYLVECFWPGVNSADLAESAHRLDRVSQALRQEGRPIEFVGSILVVDDESLFCLFDGTEADVRAVTANAGLQIDRVLAALRSDGRKR